MCFKMPKAIVTYLGYDILFIACKMLGKIGKMLMFIKVNGSISEIADWEYNALI